MLRVVVILLGIIVLLTAVQPREAQTVTFSAGTFVTTNAALQDAPQRYINQLLALVQDQLQATKLQDQSSQGEEGCHNEYSFPMSRATISNTIDWTKVRLTVRSYGVDLYFPTSIVIVTPNSRLQPCKSFGIGCCCGSCFDELCNPTVTFRLQIQVVASFYFSINAETGVLQVTVPPPVFLLSDLGIEGCNHYSKFVEIFVDVEGELKAKVTKSIYESLNSYSLSLADTYSTLSTFNISDNLFVSYRVNQIQCVEQAYCAFGVSLGFIATDTSGINQTYSGPPITEMAPMTPPAPISGFAGLSVARWNAPLLLRMLSWAEEITGALNVDDYRSFLDAVLHTVTNVSVPEFTLQGQQINTSIDTISIQVFCSANASFPDEPNTPGELLGLRIQKVTGVGSLVVANNPTGAYIQLQSLGLDPMSILLDKPTVPVPNDIIGALVNRSIPYIINAFNAFAISHRVTLPPSIDPFIPNPMLDIEGDFLVFSSYCSCSGGTRWDPCYLPPGSCASAVVESPYQITLNDDQDEQTPVAYLMMLFLGQCTLNPGDYVDFGFLHTNGSCDAIGLEYWGIINSDSASSSLTLSVCYDEHCQFCELPTNLTTEKIAGEEPECLNIGGFFGVISEDDGEQFNVPLQKNISLSDVLLIAANTSSTAPVVVQGTINSLPARVTNLGGSMCHNETNNVTYSVTTNDTTVTIAAECLSNNCTSCDSHLVTAWNQNFQWFDSPAMVFNVSTAPFKISTIPPVSPPPVSPPPNTSHTIEIIFIVLLVAFLGVLIGFLCYRRWKRRENQPDELQELLEQGGEPQVLDNRDDVPPVIPFEWGEFFHRGFNRYQLVALFCSIALATVQIRYNPIEQSLFIQLYNEFPGQKIDISNLNQATKYWWFLNLGQGLIMATTQLLVIILYATFYQQRMHELARTTRITGAVLGLVMLFTAIMLPPYMLGAAGVIQFDFGDLKDLDTAIQETVGYLNSGLRIMFSGFFVGLVADVFLWALLPIPSAVIFQTYRSICHHQHLWTDTRVRIRLLLILVLFNLGIVAPLPVVMYLFQQFDAGMLWLVSIFLLWLEEILVFVYVCLHCRSNQQRPHSSIDIAIALPLLFYAIPFYLQAQNDQTISYTVIRAVVSLLSCSFFQVLTRDIEDYGHVPNGNDNNDNNNNDNNNNDNNDNNNNDNNNNDDDDDNNDNNNNGNDEGEACSNLIVKYLLSEERPVYFRLGLFVATFFNVMVLFMFVLPDSKQHSIDVLHATLVKASGSNFTWPTNSSQNSFVPVADLKDKANHIALFPLFCAGALLVLAVLMDIFSKPKTGFAKVLSYWAVGFVGLAIVASNMIPPFFNYTDAFPINQVICDCANEFSSTLKKILKNVVGQLMGVMLQADFLIVFCSIPIWLYRGIVNLAHHQPDPRPFYGCALASLMIAPLLSAFPLLVTQQIFGDWWSLLIQLAWYCIPPLMAGLPLRAGNFKYCYALVILVYLGLLVSMVVRIAVINGFWSTILSTLGTCSFWFSLISELSLSLIVVGVIIHVIFE